MRNDQVDAGLGADAEQGSATANQKWPRTTLVWAGVGALAFVLILGSYLTARDGGFGGKSDAPASAPTKLGDPNEVAAPGSDLLKVSSPPDNTRTGIKLTKDLGDAAFDVSFAPYGYGPSSGSLVIRIDSVAATRGSNLATDFAATLKDTNLLVRTTPESAASVRIGGRYQGKLELQSTDEESSFVLTSAERSAQ